MTMKTYHIGIMGWLLLAFLSACDDNKEKLYEGEASLHLNLAGNQLDSMTYSFVGTTADSMVVQIPVELAGYAVAYDRPFRLVVNEELTTAVAGRHYDPLPAALTLEKDCYSTQVPVKIRNAGDLDTVTVKLVLDLEPGDDFSAGISRRQRATIVYSNRVPTIEFWDFLYFRYFGAYSKLKHRYILSELKLEKLEDNLEFFYDEMDESVWNAYGMHMNNYFSEHEVNDEYGRRILPWF